MDIRIVSKSDCPFCLMTKRWLEEHGFEYEEQLMDNEEERLAFYQSLNDLEETIGKSSAKQKRINSVPQIFIDDERIGGYDQLMKLGCKIFLPFSLIWVVLTAGFLLYFDLLPSN